MISIFSKYNPIQSANVEDAKLRYVRDRFKSELENIREYYRYREGKVKNSNMLSRLITSSAPNYNKDIFDYLRIIDSTAIYNSKAFDIVSDINKGSILESIIFGYNSYELFIYEESDIDILSIEDNWADLIPIKAIRYNGTDINLTMPSNSINFDMPTLSVFKIDVRLLLMQYRLWALERVSKDFSTDPASFIYSIVFPNMIASILDLSIINRFNKIYNNLPITLAEHQHPFNILDLTKNVDSIIKNTIKYINSGEKDYTAMLRNIHLIDNENAYDIMFEPELGNRQSRWAYFLSKVPCLLMLLNMTDKNNAKKNKDTLNELKIYLKLLERERSMDHINNDEIELNFILNFNILKQKLEELR